MEPSLRDADLLATQYDSLLYQRLKIVTVVAQIVSVTATWVNHKISDFYKISHAVSFLCLAIVVSALAVSEAAVTARD